MSFPTRESFRSFLLQHANETLSEEKIEEMVDDAFPPSTILFVVHFPPQIERAISGEHLYIE